MSQAPRENHYMPTRIEDSQPVTNTYGDHDSLAFHDAVDTTTTEQPNDATDPTIQGLQDSRVQLARQGVDISLRSLQVWADLTRQRGLTAPGSSAGATYGLFEKLLVTQRQVINELVAAQRQFAQQCLTTTLTVGDGPAFQ
jgi:hypothetical protein